MKMPQNIKCAIKTIYVSPAGDDANDGLSPETALRSPEAARALIRILKQIKRNTRFEVIFASGVYAVTNAFELTQEDSGLFDLPTVWKSAPDGRAVFSAGTMLRGGENASCGALYDRLPAETRERVIRYDLRENGISDLGGYARYAGYVTKLQSRLDLYKNGEICRLAAYPHDGYIVNEGLAGDVFSYEEHDTMKTASRDALTFSDKTLLSWKTTRGMFSHGYFAWDWADIYRGVTRIDADKKLVYLDPATEALGYWYIKEKSRYRFINVPEELKTPGDYVLDFDEYALYYLPEDSYEQGSLCLASNDRPIVSFTGATDIAFENIDFYHTGGSVALMTDCLNISVYGCGFYCAGADGLKIDGGSSLRVENCVFGCIGESCVNINAGNSENLANANITVADCKMHNYGIWKRTYSLGIFACGTGFRLSGNEIYDAPHGGIMYQGRDILIENNDIHDIAYETNDVGAIYGGRRWSNQNVTIRGNCIKNVGMEPGSQGWNWGAIGIYMDDFQSNQIITGNTVENCGVGAMLGGGRFNIVEDNRFTNCHVGVHVDARGKTWAKNFFDGRFTFLFDEMSSVNPDKRPASNRYPHLATFCENDPAWPTGNIIRGNTFEKTDIPVNLHDNTSEIVDYTENTII